MYEGRRSMTWGEFSQVIKRATKLGRGVRIYSGGAWKRNVVTIIDYDLLRRENSCKWSKYGMVNDTLANTIVCNAGWDKGVIPIFGHSGVERDGVVVKMPVRGVIGTLRILHSKGVINKTEEVDELIKMGDRRRQWERWSKSRR